MFERPVLHIRTVDVNSLDTNGIVWQLGGNPSFVSGQLVCLQSLCRPHKLFETFVFSPLSKIASVTDPNEDKSIIVVSGQSVRFCS